MKRILPIALLLFVCIPALGGDIPEPGKQPPPPCTENCTTTSSTTTTTTSTITLTELAVWLLTMLPK